MRIGGIQKHTLIDYPGHISAIIFTIGCNFRCPYCYNKSLVENTAKHIDEKKILGFLEKRKGLLDGVVITGGEPLLHKDLKEFIKKLKEMGYDVKLDTNGTSPEKLKELIDKKLIDYIAMDIKGPIEKYDIIAGVKVDKDKIKKSVEIIKKFPNHEFRTTVVPDLLKKEDILKIADWLKGAQKYFLQQFQKKETMLDEKFYNKRQYTLEELNSFADSIRNNFNKCTVRND
ncbi:anaerobic ribonucleoside-triphosphate reductase activating protein [Candidatus Woesearchaeota archaeon]|nr:anaerobic ribonucleoside-triphosphate reductase activating protein [Candidatus Woesearchaeota archaeon]